MKRPQPNEDFFRTIEYYAFRTVTTIGLLAWLIKALWHELGF